MLHGLYVRLRARVTGDPVGGLKLLSILALATGLCLPPASAQTAFATAVDDGSCYLEDLSERLDCGFVTVPENYALPAGKQIQIHFVVMPAIKRKTKHEALLAIAGGPGQSAIDNAPGFNRMLAKVRQTRDIILIDQRGTGRSNLLQCDGDDFEAPLAINEDDFDTEVETQKCLAALDADVTQYGSLNALRDFEAVRIRLGYRKLHLYGVSYGTRMAQLYMRHYPEHLATVTLDGVVPMQQSVLAIGNAISRAFELLLSDCRENSLCHGQFPTLAADFNRVDAQLTQAPAISQTRDPLTGESTQLTMTLSKFKGAIRMALYMPNVRALIPHAIHQAANNNFQPIVGLYAMTLDSAGIAMGMHAAVICGEDWPRLTPELKAASMQTYFGKEMINTFEQTCPIWGVPSVDADFSQAVQSDIPTLLLSGEFDPATPPSWGEMATEKLSNAKHFIAPYATHGVAYQSCGNKLIAELVDSGSVSELDAECLNKDIRRNFYLNASTVEAIPAATDKPAPTAQP